MEKKEYQRPQVKIYQVDCPPLLAASDESGVADDGFSVGAKAMFYDFEEEEAGSAAAKGHSMWDEEY